MSEKPRRFSKIRKIISDAVADPQRLAEQHGPDPSPAQIVFEASAHLAHEIGRRPVLRGIAYTAYLGGIYVGNRLLDRLNMQPFPELESTKDHVGKYATQFAENLLTLHPTLPPRDVELDEFHSSASSFLNAHLKLEAAPARDGTAGEYELRTHLKTNSGDKPTAEDVELIEITAFTNRSPIFRAVQPANPDCLFGINFTREPNGHWTVNVYYPTPKGALLLSRHPTQDYGDGTPVLNKKTFATISAAVTQGFNNAIQGTPTESSTIPTMNNSTSEVE